MKAQELRIGSLVNTKKYNITVKVKHIYNELMLGCGNLNDEYDEFDPMIEDVEPIPLTEEWLVKMGFEYFFLWWSRQYT